MDLGEKSSSSPRSAALPEMHGVQDTIEKKKAPNDKRCPDHPGLNLQHRSLRKRNVAANSEGATGAAMRTSVGYLSSRPIQILWVRREVCGCAAKYSAPTSTVTESICRVCDYVGLARRRSHTRRTITMTANPIKTFHPVFISAIPANVMPWSPNESRAHRAKSGAAGGRPAPASRKRSGG